MEPGSWSVLMDSMEKRLCQANTESSLQRHVNVRIFSLPIKLAMGVVRLVSVLVAQNAYFVNQMKELQKQVRGTLMEDATAKVLLLLVGNIFMSKLQHLQVLWYSKISLKCGGRQIAKKPLKCISILPNNLRKGFFSFIIWIFSIHLYSWMILPVRPLWHT